ncbi:MAG TPA: 30S ribosomal protein S1 [Gammaproteobacteria bacterium]|nr:30S ribosomal protein S1 [Gammaproteobacteria bacterium]
MVETFAELFESSLSKSKMYPGAIVTGKVIGIGNDFVTINVGLKSEGQVPIEQFQDLNGSLEVQVGDDIEVALDAVENGWGETRLSREKAKRAKAWISLSKAFENNQPVMGVISGKVKGGFTVELDSIRAFLPGSLVDVRPVRDPSGLEGKELEFKVIKLDQKRNNVVVSRRSVVESESSAEREALLGNLQEGQEVKGIVKNLTDYGAFVDLGGIDGLLHITDMAWRRVKHPSEIVHVGQELNVKVLKFDRDKSRVSLGLKQLGSDPWVDITQRYAEGTRLTGKVTNITDYGCFVEIEEGVEGLVHVSEMDWTNKNIHPSKVVQLGMDVEVMVLDIDEERRRISLGLKQCQDNPWDAFATTCKKGDKVSGKIKSITDFGIFIGLPGGIDGLIHLSDLSWNDTGETVVRQYKKGQEIEAVVLAIDAERERISLGIKQLEQDPFSMYVADHNKGTLVTGTVASVDAKGAVITLIEGVEGILKASELGRDRVEDASTVLKVGEQVESKIINVDRKNRVITLSIRAKDIEDEQESLREYNKTGEEIAGATLGDLLKEKMEHRDQ